MPGIHFCGLEMLKMKLTWRKIYICRGSAYFYWNKPEFPDADAVNPKLKTTEEYCSPCNCISGHRSDHWVHDNPCVASISRAESEFDNTAKTLTTHL